MGFCEHGNERSFVVKSQGFCWCYRLKECMVILWDPDEDYQGTNESGTEVKTAIVSGHENQNFHKD